jgi:hypothetical protein
MKRLLICTAAAAAFLGLVLAADDAEFQKWMKATGATCGSLKKNLDAKNADGAVADAKKLTEIMKDVEHFWHGKNVQGAMKIASDAGAGFKEIGDLAAAGKFDDGSAALKKTMGNCGGCHNTYREKASDGSWKIKY